MNELITRVERFLSENPSNVISVSQESLKLSKSSAPKYAFTLDDISQIFGSVTEMIRELPNRGFRSGTKVALRRMYGTGGEASYATHQTLTLNFVEPSQVSVERELPQPMMPSVPQPIAMGMPSMMGYAQIPQHDWIKSEVIKERFEDLKKQNTSLEDELKDRKSRIRQLEEENFTLRLKIDTLEEKHEVRLQRELLKKKGFWESSVGENVVNSLGQIATAVAENYMSVAQETPVALAGSHLSPTKQAFINFISQPEITDQQVEYVFNLIQQNDE